MTPTILLALARLANVEAQHALERGQEADALYLLDLHEQIHQAVATEYPEPDWAPGEQSHWHRASEYLAGRDRFTSEVVPPPPDPTWADLGV